MFSKVVFNDFTDVKFFEIIKFIMGIKAVSWEIKKSVFENSHLSKKLKIFLRKIIKSSIVWANGGVSRWEVVQLR